MKTHWLICLVLLAAACNSGQPAGDAYEDELLDDDPSASHGPADTFDDENRARRIQVLGSIGYGESRAVPDHAEEGAWTFYGGRGTVVEAEATGASGLAFFGPKEPGNSWPEAFESGAQATLSATLPDDGLYAVWVTGEVGTPEVSLHCPSGVCAPTTWIQEIPEDVVTVVLAGDLGLTVSDAPVDHSGGYKYMEFHYYYEMLEGIAHFIEGDVTLANLETAITAGGDRQDKRYVFRMPLEGLEAVFAAGFNLLGAANNHTGDYGVSGVLETVEALDDAQDSGRLLGWAGAGEGFAAAADPTVFDVAGVTIAYASCGIGYDVRSTGAGVAHVSDSARVIDRLVAVEADLHMLSIHAGVERDLHASSWVRGIAHDAVDAGVDVVHGHHPHVVQGIEQRGEGLIFYSFGNFELRGARNMASLGAESDYGIIARVGYDPTERRLSHLEVVPVYDMHRVVYPLSADSAARRIRTLNGLSDDFGSAGVVLDVDSATGRGTAEL